MKRALVVVAGLAAAGLIAYLATRGSGGEASESAPGAARSIAKQRDTGPARPAPASIAGRVIAAEGNAPIASAVVHLVATEGGSPAADPSSLTARTGPDGAWSLAAVPPGEYRVSATATGFLPGLVENVALTEGGSRVGVDIVLDAGGNRLAGVVSDVTGGPIGGAVVQVTPVHGILSVRADHSYAAMTGADGGYELHLADGRYRVTAFHGDYGPQAELVELRGGERTLDFALTPGAVIEGVVLSESTGEPVPHAAVSYGREAMMAMPGGGMLETSGGNGLVFAGADGAFRIRGLQAGAVSLRGSATGYSSVEPTTVSLGIAEQVTGVEVFVSEGFAVRGKVVVDGDESKPAEGVTVVAMQPGAGFGEATDQPTGPDGAFVLDGLQPGRYRLEANGKRFVRTMMPGKSVTVDGADVDGVTLSVKSGATITGRVEPPGIAEVGIEVAPRGGGSGIGLGLDLGNLTMGTVRTKPDGSFSLGPVRPGDVTLVARSGDGRKGKVELNVASSGKDGVVIALEAKATLRGRVVDADGLPVNDALVSLSKRQSNQRVVMVINGRDAMAEQSPTHEDGSFAIRGLDGGDYELTVLTHGGERLAWADAKRKADAAEPRQITLPENGDKTVTLKVEARNAAIAGVVVGPDGAPVADAWVTATPRRGRGPLGGGMPDVDELRKRARERATAERDGEDSEVRAMVMVMSDDTGGDGDHGATGGGGLGMRGAVPPVLTDGDGRFEITGLRKGSYDLMAEGMRGTARGFEPGVDTGSDATVKLVALTRIDGTVTRGGEPVEQFHVQVNGKSIRSKSVRNSDGKFSIHRVDPGDYTIDVSAADGKGQARVTVVAGKPASVSIDLASLAEVTGQVFGADGQPAGGAMVLLGSGSLADGDSNVSITMTGDDAPTTTDPNGVFSIPAPAGQHILMVLDPETHQPIAMRQFEVQPGQTNVDLGKVEPGPEGGGLGLRLGDD